ncbi:hypothetical protein L0244_35845, partial [bacterium]|nr:hypothetical protein [bacterium]
ISRFKVRHPMVCVPGDYGLNEYFGRDVIPKSGYLEGAGCWIDGLMERWITGLLDRRVLLIQQ